MVLCGSEQGVGPLGLWFSWKKGGVHHTCKYTCTCSVYKQDIPPGGTIQIFRTEWESERERGREMERQRSEEGVWKVE